MTAQMKVRMNRRRSCVCTRVFAAREEDLINATLKVITLIKAVMCGDRTQRGVGGVVAMFYGAV